MKTKTQAEYEEKDWCKKLVCGCTHNWQDIDFNREVEVRKNNCTGTRRICDRCGYYPWVYKYPVYYSIHKRVFI